MNKQHQMALRMARKQIYDRKVGLICLALDQVGYDHPAFQLACEELKTYIQAKLHPDLTLLNWQKNNRIYHNSEQRRQDRINWISWMLGELD